MRAIVITLAFTLLAAAAAAQQPAAPPAVQAIKTYTSSADVAALIVKAKNERKADQAVFSQPLLSLAPYNAILEYRGIVGPAAVHEREMEIFYIVEGTATMVTGGKLVKETRTNPTNLSGTAIEGGTSQTVSKGDFIIVPENTPHWFSMISGNGVLVDVSIHLPRPVPSFAEMERLVPAVTGTPQPPR
jgi:mannose-6-phosphate isomerase-like protein (cupin superfamily)